jgi:HrpA-like RNA helicase
VTSPVGPPSARDEAWADLAAELTPVKSLARIDAVTARAITTVTVVGVLLTGLGAASAALPAQPGLARALAAAAAIAAALAVAAALTGQVLTITRRLNPANLDDVKAWYRRQFGLRAYPAQAATALLLLSAVLAGASAASDLLAGPATTPALTITQVPGPGRLPATRQQATITASVTFDGLSPGQPATVVLTTPGATGTLARAAATATRNGTAVITLTTRFPAAQTIAVTAADPHQTCQATLSPAQLQPVLTCHGH